MVSPDLLNPQKLLANDPGTIRAYEEFIASKLRQFIDDPSRIRELTQSAMRRLIEGLREGDTPTPETLMRYISNRTVDAMRLELRALRRVVASNLESSLHEHASADASDRLATRETLEKIEALLSDLDERDRDMFIAKVRGHSNAEIAQQAGVTKAVVRSSVSRTRQRLQQQLTAEGKRESLRQQAKQWHESASRTRVQDEGQ